MGVGTLRGYNLYQPPGCNPQTRNHKQPSIFVELADAFSLTENPCDNFDWKSLLTLMAHGSVRIVYSGMKNYPRTTQMDTKDAPDDWLQYALKIQSHINFWPSYGDF